jgi:membrane protein DedA with SNARE-associated domain
MHTVQFLARLVEHHDILVYALIFLGVLIEGEFVILCSGILIHLGALSLPFTFLLIFVAGLCKTFLGYSIGVFIREKWRKVTLVRYIEKHVSNMMPHFQKKPFWSIFISKFLMINHAVIIFAGYKKVDFRKYLKAELISTSLWAPGLLIIGYFFSYAAIRVSHEVWEFSLIVLGLIALFIILDKLVSWAYQVFEEFYDPE